MYVGFSPPTCFHKIYGIQCKIGRKNNSDYKAFALLTMDFACRFFPLLLYGFYNGREFTARIHLVSLPFLPVLLCYSTSMGLEREVFLHKPKLIKQLRNGPELLKRLK